MFECSNLNLYNPHLVNKIRFQTPTPRESFKLTITNQSQLGLISLIYMSHKLCEVIWCASWKLRSIIRCARRSRGLRIYGVISNTAQPNYKQNSISARFHYRLGPVGFCQFSTEITNCNFGIVVI